MSFPTNIKVEDLTQEAFDDMVTAYNQMSAALSIGNGLCISIIRKGHGVDSTDIRFHDRMLAHDIMLAYDPGFK